MKRNKYVLVSLNFPGPKNHDETITFCVNGASERRAAQIGKELSRKKLIDYSGYAVRKDKRGG